MISSYNYIGYIAIRANGLFSIYVTQNTIYKLNIEREPHTHNENLAGK